jgi:hypothetical protein
MAKNKKIVKRQYREVDVTPKMAKELLAHNDALDIPQRTRSKAHVAQYARMMRMGDWECNGVTIKISARGAIVDGQHRLAAVVQAGVPIRMAIARNVAEESFGTIDRGKNRSFREVLGIHGETNPQNLSTALMWLHLYEHKNMLKREARTVQDVIRCLERNPKLRRSVDFARTLRGSICSKGLIAFAHYIFRQKATLSDVETFFMRLSEGVMLKKGEPVLVLRNRLLDNKRTRLGRGKLRALDILAMIFKAWRHHVAGEKIERLLWKQGKGSRKGKEDFPYLNDSIMGRLYVAPKPNLTKTSGPPSGPPSGRRGSGN